MGHQKGDKYKSIHDFNNHHQQMMNESSYKSIMDSPPPRKDKAGSRFKNQSQNPSLKVKQGQLNHSQLDEDMRDGPILPEIKNSHLSGHNTSTMMDKKDKFLRK